MKHNIYTFEAEIKIPGLLEKIIAFSLSKYADCLIIILNQTGAVGSLIQGIAMESTAQLQEEDNFESEEKPEPLSNYLFEIKTLFGSTEIQFYELLLGRMMNIIWQQLKCQQKFKVILNISLPLFDKQFNQQLYYKQIMEHFRKDIKNVL